MLILSSPRFPQFRSLLFVAIFSSSITTFITFYLTRKKNDDTTQDGAPPPPKLKPSPPPPPPLSPNQPHLRVLNVDNLKAHPSTTWPNLMHGNIKYNKLIEPDECIVANVKTTTLSPVPSEGYVRAGPRELLHFDPMWSTAAIVTCGGLCPGLNNIIRELVNTLFHLYNVKSVLGVRGGYAGFSLEDTIHKPISLTPESVSSIHLNGGSILGTSRGGFKLQETVAFLQKHSVNMLFVIGGDGTHRGAYRIHEKLQKLKLNVAVAGIPKTIDNDIGLIDRSFGFDSAVAAALTAIRAARVEADCNLPNGIGIVKLMGRSAGFVAAHAALASLDVDLVLIPEVKIILEGADGILPYLRARVKERGSAVVVVAEGAGEELLGLSTETDASGNKKLPAIGQFLKGAISRHFDEHNPSQPATVKYIDPSYMIRSCPANATDSFLCMQLAQNAVHGVFGGLTGFSVGLCNNRMVYLPIPTLCDASPRTLDPHGRTWERVLSMTRQPSAI